MSVTTTALGAYLIMSVVAFALYSSDKRRAVRRQWRVSETTLHAIELLGGWPGAWVAQQTLRHKNQKRRYMMMFWTIVSLHLLGWVSWSLLRA